MFVSNSILSYSIFTLLLKTFDDYYHNLKTSWLLERFSRVVTPFWYHKVQAAGDQLIPPIVFSGITLYLSDISMQTKDLFGTGSASILSEKKNTRKASWTPSIEASNLCWANTLLPSMRSAAVGRRSKHGVKVPIQTHFLPPSYIHSCRKWDAVQIIARNCFFLFGQLHVTFLIKLTFRKHLFNNSDSLIL